MTVTTNLSTITTASQNTNKQLYVKNLKDINTILCNSFDLLNGISHENEARLNTLLINQNNELDLILNNLAIYKINIETYIKNISSIKPNLPDSLNIHKNNIGRVGDPFSDAFYA